MNTSTREIKSYVHTFHVHKHVSTATFRDVITPPTPHEYKSNSKIIFYELYIYLLVTQYHLEKLYKITVGLIYNCLRYISHGCHGDRYFTMNLFG